MRRDVSLIIDIRGAMRKKQGERFRAWFGQQLRDIRTDDSIQTIATTQQSMAQVLSYNTTGGYAAIERAERGMGLETFCQLCVKLGIEPGIILKLEELKRVFAGKSSGEGTNENIQV